ASMKDAEKQVLEDMQTTKEVMWEVFGVPFIFFERPQWDKFAGAVKTFAADSLAPSGRVIQQPSTHLLGQNFAKPFNVVFVDEKGKEQHCFMTCYGPAISRIFASVIAVHGDKQGLCFPWEIAPKQIVIVPVFKGDEAENKKTLKKAKSLLKQLSRNFDVMLDDSKDKSLGEKFYYWEMKGVPLRIELGPRELAEDSCIVFRRDTKEKIKVSLKDLKKKVKALGKEISRSLKEKASRMFEGNIVKAKSMEGLKQAIEGKKIVKADFCSIDWAGENCSLKVREATQATIRGVRVDGKEKPEGNCIACGKPAGCVVYIAKQY
ncbi:proline--tRNA ligase, partial [archaeon]|nr:proline--tRNA ligase [archaeon]